MTQQISVCSHMSVLSAHTVASGYILKSAALDAKCLTIRVECKDKLEMRQITSFTKMPKPENYLNPDSVHHQSWRGRLGLLTFLPFSAFPVFLSSGHHPIAVLITKVSVWTPFLLMRSLLYCIRQLLCMSLIPSPPSLRDLLWLPITFRVKAKLLPT